jgi:hypothetical protein
VIAPPNAAQPGMDWPKVSRRDGSDGSTTGWTLEVEAASRTEVAVP